MLVVVKGIVVASRKTLLSSLLDIYIYASKNCRVLIQDGAELSSFCEFHVIDDNLICCEYEFLVVQNFVTHGLL